MNKAKYKAANGASNQATTPQTGLKRKSEYLYSDEEQVQPPAAKHPAPSLHTSRCTVQAISGHQALLQDPPTFPGEPLNPCLGVWGWLPPSLLEEFRRMRYAPFMQTPQKAPEPLPPVPSDIPLTVVAQPTVDMGAETDAQLLEQLHEVCKKQVSSKSRASTAVTTLQRAEPLQERIALLIKQGEIDKRMAQGLLPLIQHCETGTRVRNFIMSLFLAMRRTPDSFHRKDFIEHLPPTLSPELQGHATVTESYWRGLTINAHCTEETQDLARAVCQHFGW